MYTEDIPRAEPSENALKALAADFSFTNSISKQ